MKNSWAAIRDRLRMFAELVERFALHPLYASAVTFLIIFTGGYGSLFSVEIRSAFPFSWGPFGDFVWEAGKFWTLTLLAALMFFFRQRAEDREYDARQSELKRQTDKLESLIRTLPPENFLERQARFYLSAEEASEVALGSKSADQAELIDSGIRHILRIVATLAQSFDGDHQEVCYAANIMLFRPSVDFDTDTEAAIQSRLRFCDPDVPCKALEGVLDIDRALSTVSTSEKAEPDPNLRALSLPIPFAIRTELGKYRVLPGAACIREQRIFIFRRHSQAGQMVHRKRRLYAGGDEQFARVLSYVRTYAQFSISSAKGDRAASRSGRSGRRPAFGRPKYSLQPNRSIAGRRIWSNRTVEPICLGYPALHCDAGKTFTQTPQP